MPEQHRHLANKCEDTVNLQGAEAYCVATCTACSLCVVIWQQENGTALRCPCVGISEPSHSALNSVYLNSSATCFCHCRTAEDTLQRLRFWLLLTYLFSVVISRTTVTYKNVKTKMKMPPKLKWYLKLKTLLPRQLNNSGGKPMMIINVEFLTVMAFTILGQQC